MTNDLNRRDFAKSSINRNRSGNTTRMQNISTTEDPRRARSSKMKARPISSEASQKEKRFNGWQQRTSSFSGLLAGLLQD